MRTRLRTVLLLVLIAVGAPTALAQDDGTISEEEAWKLGWPTMQGPYGNFRAARTGATLIDDLAKARSM